MHVTVGIADLLPGLQSNDDEDGSPVHTTHTAAVTHEVVKDGGKLSPHLQNIMTQTLRI